MDDKTADEMLAEIQERADAATRGRWYVTISAVGTTVDACPSYPPRADTLLVFSDGEYTENRNGPNDAAFAAHSRTDVPRLVKLARKYAQFLGALQMAATVGVVSAEEILQTVKSAGEEFQRILAGEGE